MLIIQKEFKILFNKKIGLGHFKMAISAPKIVQQAKPGQFVHLRCTNGREPLLRRPFSFHRLQQNNFEIFYKVVGRGTNLLAKKRQGDRIDVLGPLGNGFDLTQETGNRQQATILVAGGMGVAPLLALAEKLAYSVKPACLVKCKAGKRIADRKEILVLIGAKTKEAVLCTKDFEKLGAKVKVATDDGSQGYKGLVTDLLKNFLRNTKYEIRNTIYACGPKSMLKEIAKIGSRFHLSSRGSLEEIIACGVGACLGCAIKTKAGYQRVCKDGPVFNLGEIRW